MCGTSSFLAAGDGAAWSEWFAPLLTSAISAAPLDLMDDWSTALRLGLNGLALTPTGLPQLLELVAGMVAPGVQYVNRFDTDYRYLLAFYRPSCCDALSMPDVTL